MIEARVIADSVNPSGCRLTSFVLTYPRFILAQLNTHRMFSRNSASSRAIPVEKMIKSVIENTVRPVSWGKNQKGMQAGEPVDLGTEIQAVMVWQDAMKQAVQHAEKLLALGIAKQITNRLLEPFAHTTTLLTATEFHNFFDLRCHKDPQPEFQVLAYAMLDAYRASTPKEMKQGQWHLPFGDAHMPERMTTEQSIKICVARAARVSYKNFEGDFSPEKDFVLHDNLIASGHMSPLEHPARALHGPKWVGNFCGWHQYRKDLPNENRRFADLDEISSRRSKP